MSSAKGEKFITMFIAKYNYKMKTLEYITAAHNPPIMYKPDSDEVSYLESGCLGLGMLDEIPSIDKGLVHMDERTKLFCYTDGLVEMIDEGGVNYDTEQIKSHVCNKNRIDENINAIIKSQGIQEGSKAIFDDISIIGAEFSP
jgi:sigma-B regulation protein RsbU (phosphoserine phosphatase)